MNKQKRIVVSVILTFFFGGFNAYNTVQSHSVSYQENPKAAIFGAVLASTLAGLAFYWLSGIFAKLGKHKIKIPSTSSGADSGKDTDIFYDEVAKELHNKILVAGLWTKAYAEMNGDSERARAFYIKLRVAQLVEANQKTNSSNKKINKKTTGLFENQILLTVITILSGLLTGIIIVVALVIAMSSPVSITPLFLGLLSAIFGVVTFKGLRRLKW